MCIFMCFLRFGNFGGIISSNIFSVLFCLFSWYDEYDLMMMFQWSLRLIFIFILFYLFIYLFIYGCAGSSFPCEGFL